MRSPGIVTLGLISLTLKLTASAGSAQTVLWNETANGDLSNNQAAPREKGK